MQRRFLLPLILGGTDIMKFCFGWVMPSTIQAIILVMGKERPTRICPNIEMAATLPAIGDDSIAGSSMISDSIAPIPPNYLRRFKQF
jgi:hypothetical protein